VAAVHQLDFLFDAVLVEEGDGVLVEVDLVLGAGGDELEELLDLPGDVVVVDDGLEIVRVLVGGADATG